MVLSLSERARKTTETNEDIVEKYSTGMEKKADKDRDNKTNESYPKTKMRNYDEVYVALSFTVIRWETRKDQYVYCALKYWQRTAWSQKRLRCLFKTK